MAELPILPLRPQALLADTLHMSAEEFGVYVRLLCAMWLHGGKLPSDPAKLAKIGGVSKTKFMKISETILQPMTSAGGEISQKRLTDTWLKVQELRRKKAEGARKRWRKNGHAQAYAEQEH
jgi:uncharacterized protein YdaU (DUF1376 family)